MDHLCPGSTLAGLGYGELSNIDWAQAYDDSLEAISRGGMLIPKGRQYSTVDEWCSSRHL